MPHQSGFAEGRFFHVQHIYVLNGPNLKVLGVREPEIYGSQTLADVEALCRPRPRAVRASSSSYRQTNAEHEMIDWIQEARNSAGIAINPAAFCCRPLTLRFSTR